MIPRATYRLQFHREFTFDDAGAITPYLARMGISHIYASPILAARAGSRHGYDVIDPSRVNPELGGEDAFRRLAERLKALGLGLVVDIVPNHMAVGGDNPWWVDVLENGHRSRHAQTFDIDWRPPDPTLRDKILLPILATPVADALERSDIALVRDEASACPAISYGAHRLPLRPEDAREIGSGALARWNAAESLRALLDRQHYRLAWWRIAGDAINWRRFFDINDLAALRMEDDAVFEAVHAKHFALYADGLIDGFRVDHVDGLADPAAYCRKLRARLERLRPGERAYLVVEKILGAGEVLPAEWDVDGTTGYDFMNDVAAVLHDPDGAEPLARLWTAISGRRPDYDGEESAARRERLTVDFAGAFQSVVCAFFALRAPGTHDLTASSLSRALLRLLAELRAYRTYATGGIDSPPPGRFFEDAVARALRRAPANDSAALAHVAAIMRGGNSAGHDAQRLAVRRFNQLAATLAAKAGEDTAFYRYGRLLSRNEVGGDPGLLAISPGEFHARASRRAGSALLATATHDHKRGEDARLRLAVLSELPETWAATVSSWAVRNAALRGPLVEPADEYQLYQTLVAAWQLEPGLRDAEAMAEFCGRIRAWRLKSLREAKLRTSWSDPDGAFEEANAAFVQALLDRDRSPEFLEELSAFAARIAAPAALYGLVQCVLCCTAPGVPDLYQGSEWWDFSLVDPDNRRPVDFSARLAAIARDEPVAALLARWRDGWVKQDLIRRLLALRGQHRDCFALGSYRPLEPAGAQARSVLAYIRRHAGISILIVVPRLCAGIAIEAAAPNPPSRFWSGTVVASPELSDCREWRSIFTTAALVAKDGALSCADLFRDFPVAVFSGSPHGRRPD